MTEHYFTPQPQSRLKKTQVTSSYKGHTLAFTCVSGVFSSEKLDRATLLLLEHVKIKKDWHVLDLGCGIGVLGISIKKAFPSCTVVLSDVNQRGLKIAADNARVNATIVEIVESDLFSKLSLRQFDAIITNPPHHAGRALVYQLIEEAVLHLRTGGLLQLVGQHNKGGAMLEKKMKEVFGNVETLVKKGGFRVYCSRKQKTI